MILPKFSRKTIAIMKQLRGESYGQNTMIEARRKLGEEVFQAVQTFRKQNSFTFSRALLHITNGWREVPTCKNPNCDNKVTFGRKGAKTEYKLYCSTRCSNSDEATREKTKHTCRRKYGVDNISQAKAIKKQKVATCLQNHGVEHPTQSRKVMKKIVKAVQEHYGVDNVSQSKEVLKAKKRTWLEKYGFDNPSKAQEIKLKIGRIVHSSSARKKVVHSHGKQYILQGFEPQALEYMRKYFKCKHIHDQSSGKVPNFEYYFDGRDRMYFPDFYVDGKDFDFVVEVKSTYTMCSTSSKFRMIKAKAKAVERAGYSFELLLMRSDGTRIEIPSDWTSLTYRQFKAVLPPDHRR